LPQVSSPTFQEVHATSVAPMRFANRVTKRIFRRWNCNQVYIRWHQAIGPNFNTPVRTPLGHQVYVSFPVLNYTVSYHSHRTGLWPFFTHFFSKTHLYSDLQLFKFMVQHAVFVKIYLPSVRCSEEAVALIRK